MSFKLELNLDRFTFTKGSLANASEEDLRSLFLFVMDIQTALDTVIPGLFNPLPPEEAALEADAMRFRDLAFKSREVLDK